MSFQDPYFHYQRWLPFRHWFGPKQWTSLPQALKYAGRVRKLALALTDDLAPHAADFARLTRLRYLDLQGWSGPPLTGQPSFALPDTMGNLTELRELLMLNLALSEVPPWLPNLTQLCYLMIRGTDITELPTDFGRLQRLELLRIENCVFPLRTLPSSFRELTTLRRLSFADTYVRHLPIDHLPPGLTHLQLSWSSQLAGVDFDALHQRFPRLQLQINGVK
ncbi:leucine-rich repeat domain-containing protein [Hymenobacter sp. CRA2]|uniref:leucine-rich repeat domain-containing protein n=1 Tax=Hymenobacter sp. CRA2 TaxID=1955620 RepID=UPI0009901956|nr:leucine-rich repeat domain-containing protein [Hymenobacter sp. CRA2]OON68558.1 hypothetical protein B0919_13035 [Hymenobacter sp. CRA2]